MERSRSPRLDAWAQHRQLHRWRPAAGWAIMHGISPGIHSLFIIAHDYQGVYNQRQAETRGMHASTRAPLAPGLAERSLAKDWLEYSHEYSSSSSHEWYVSPAPRSAGGKGESSVCTQVSNSHVECTCDLADVEAAVTQSSSEQQQRRSPSHSRLRVHLSVLIICIHMQQLHPRIQFDLVSCPFRPKHKRASGRLGSHGVLSRPRREVWRNEI